MKNREIKFRAKRIQSHGDDWEYGNYAYFCQYPDSENKHIMLPNGWQIDENTLGQFTGLHDKNGKEIYEGDIVKRPSSNCTLEQMAYGRIVFQRGCFKILWKDKKLSGIYDNLYYHDLDCEIIGNIYQHPDLLK